MRRAVLALALVTCGGDERAAPGPTDPAAVDRTVRDLAAMGERRVGTAPAAAAATYLHGRLRDAGIADVSEEAFMVPRIDYSGAELALTGSGGAALDAPFEILEGSGGGATDAAIVDCGGATDNELVGLDLHGKVALVGRRDTYHRSSQYRNVAQRGAVAMLYTSDAPGDLRQVGSVRRTFEAVGPIPAFSLGAESGARLRAAMPARAHLSLAAAVTPAGGRNVVARIPGRTRGEIVVGAHFDSWFAGSNDNAAGAAALVALAARRAHAGGLRHTLVFVGYDGEETGLYGGYAYMHDHRPDVVAVLNFEVPAARNAALLGFGRSNHAVLDDALQGAGMRGLYPFYVNMDAIPALFGGIIPTDIQGMYRDGVPTATTASTYDHYHTAEDTPEKVDIDFLARVVDAFDAAIVALDAAADEALAVRDPALWRAAVEVHAGLVVDVAVTDGAGAPQAGAPVEATLLADDFFVIASARMTAGPDGRATLTLTDDPARARRFLHVTSGPTYPLVETVVGLSGKALDSSSFWK